MSYNGWEPSPTATTPSRSSSTSTGGQHSPGWNAYRASITQGDVPRAVHTLLASTKQLQDVLRDWSLGQATELQVSDVYVQIGTEFNAIIAAFAYHQIDLSDLHSVPNEMRDVLEQCLAEEPTPEALEQFMPQLKELLIKLLRGLQDRQNTWQTRAMVNLNGGSPRNSR